MKISEIIIYLLIALIVVCIFKPKIEVNVKNYKGDYEKLEEIEE